METSINNSMDLGRGLVTDSSEIQLSDMKRIQKESDQNKAFKNGQWIYNFNNGDKYEGDWNNDQMEGVGVLYYKDGSKYVGRFSKNKRSGYGVYRFSNGNCYEGYGKMDIKKDLVFLSFLMAKNTKDRNKYVGNWKTDKRHGEGEYYFNSNGDKKKGVFDQDVLLGQFTFYYKDGRVEQKDN
ncbi:hypothetical protein ABPG72_005325 [Tetrahymena utriculariae]